MQTVSEIYNAALCRVPIAAQALIHLLSTEGERSITGSSRSRVALVYLMRSSSRRRSQQSSDATRRQQKRSVIKLAENEYQTTYVRHPISCILF